MAVNSKHLTFTPIQYPKIKVFITESPNDLNLKSFIDQIQEHKIKHIVRLCDPTYDEKDLNLDYEIKIHEWKFADGDIPSNEIIENWKKLLEKNEPIVIHCLAGLGRAPTIVAIGLIENNTNPYDVIKIIRDKRPGSINSKQLNFLINYKPTNKKTSFLSKFFRF
jgi:protein tyrosine phosphatase type 4A